jgi:hypothetical protein
VYYQIDFMKVGWETVSKDRSSDRMSRGSCMAYRFSQHGDLQMHSVARVNRSPCWFRDNYIHDMIGSDKLRWETASKLIVRVCYWGVVILTIHVLQLLFCF